MRTRLAWSRRSAMSAPGCGTPSGRPRGRNSFDVVPGTTPRSSSRRRWAPRRSRRSAALRSPAWPGLRVSSRSNNTVWPRALLDPGLDRERILPRSHQRIEPASQGTSPISTSIPPLGSAFDHLFDGARPRSRLTTTGDKEGHRGRLILDVDDGGGSAGPGEGPQRHAVRAGATGRPWLESDRRGDRGPDAPAGGPRLRLRPASGDVPGAPPARATRTRRTRCRPPGGAPTDGGRG